MRLGGGTILLGAAAFFASAALAALVRRYALSHALLDVPNERSSHSVPTPRGGGLAIATVVLAGLVVLERAHLLVPRIAFGLFGGGLLVAVVGWLDDRHELRATVRIVVHVAAAAWTLAWLGGMPNLTVAAEATHLGLGGTLLAMLGIVWLTNLYNFMDGIDGLAAAEAFIVSAAGVLLLAGPSPALALVALLVAAAAAGFLVWNWPPARLFMGDVGSGFLGYTFGALALASENARALPALVWLVMLGPFFVDATVTLLRRMVRGERWYAGHRTHAYQRVVQGGWRHWQVSLLIAGLSAILAAAGHLVVRTHSGLGYLVVGAVAGLGLLYLIVERCCPMPPVTGYKRPEGESL
ncbi:MAG: MraY family glycosyltransferase [Gemmatimonadales bacterium]|jgi:Fuc2NAc and GlcNAc transferase